MQNGASGHSKWKEAVDPRGKKYYYNSVTKETSWTKPPELEESERQIENSPHNPQKIIVCDWKESYDSTRGKVYYYNKVTKKTSWVKPQELIDAEHPEISSESTPNGAASGAEETRSHLEIALEKIQKKMDDPTRSPEPTKINVKGKNTKALDESQVEATVQSILQQLERFSKECNDAQKSLQTSDEVKKRHQTLLIETQERIKSYQSSIADEKSLLNTLVQRSETRQTEKEFEYAQQSNLIQQIGDVRSKRMQLLSAPEEVVEKYIGEFLPEIEREDSMLNLQHTRNEKVERHNSSMSQMKDQLEIYLSEARLLAPVVNQLRSQVSDQQRHVEKIQSEATTNHLRCEALKDEIKRLNQYARECIDGETELNEAIHRQKKTEQERYLRFHELQSSVSAAQIEIANLEWKGRSAIETPAQCPNISNFQLSKLTDEQTKLKGAIHSRKLIKKDLEAQLHDAQKEMNSAVKTIEKITGEGDKLNEKNSLLEEGNLIFLREQIVGIKEKRKALLSSLFQQECNGGTDLSLLDELERTDGVLNMLKDCYACSVEAHTAKMRKDGSAKKEHHRAADMMEAIQHRFGMPSETPFHCHNNQEKPAHVRGTPSFVSKQKQEKTFHLSANTSTREFSPLSSLLGGTSSPVFSEGDTSSDESCCDTRSPLSSPSEPGARNTPRFQPKKSVSSIRIGEKVHHTNPTKSVKAERQYSELASKLRKSFR